jgi:multiple sugar transport system permease protein
VGGIFNSPPTSYAGWIMKKSHRWTQRQRRDLKHGLLFLSPWLIGFVVFTLYPMVASLVISFADYRFHKPLSWVGLENYRQLFQDRLFWISLANTGYMVLIGVPLILLISFLCATLLNLKIRGQSFYRVMYFLPAIVPTIASVLLWVWVLNPSYGLLNSTLRLIGIQGPNWLADPNWSKPALLLLSIWGSGQTIVIYLSALQDVPTHLIEAAELDGANWWQRMIHITIPMVAPVTIYNLITGAIAMFQFFSQAYVFARISSGATTGNWPIGAPLNSTLFYSVYLYQNGFSFMKFGYASAMGWILFLIILASTILLLRVSEKFAYYAN